MTDWFIPPDIETNPITLATQAKQDLKDRWPDWDENRSDLDVILIDLVAALAANSATAARRFLSSLFRTFGTKLVGIQYFGGSPARGLITITLSDSDGHLIPRGYAVDIDGYEFTVDQDTIVGAGASSISGVAVTCTTVGTVGNGLEGGQVFPAANLSFVSLVELDAPTTNGADPDDDATFQSDLAQKLRLMAETIVTESDIENFALLWPGIGRAVFQNDGARNITGAVADITGQAVLSGVKDDLVAAIQELLQVNTTFDVQDPTYNEISVTYTAVAYPYPNVDKVELKSRIDAAIASYLDPATFGSPPFESDPSQWVNDTLIRQYKLIGIVESLDGLNYIDELEITGDLGAASAGDWEMSGDFPLPTAGVITGTVL
jgi:uncharacterized phage protein gp47/JayE